MKISEILINFQNSRNNQINSGCYYEIPLEFINNKNTTLMTKIKTKEEQNGI